VRVIVLTARATRRSVPAPTCRTAARLFLRFFQTECRLCRPAQAGAECTKPAIARVGGVCMAGGMGLLCMTDMAVAAVT